MPSRSPPAARRVPVDAEVLDKRLNTFTMDGPKVWEFAVNAVPRTIRALLRGARAGARAIWTC